MTWSGQPTLARDKDALRRLGDGCHTAVESGLGRGIGALLLAKHFKTVFTIELDAGRLTKYGPSVPARASNATLIYGDSAKAIENLAKAIDAPVFWYLDAHTRRGKHKDKFPLWKELAILNKRTQPDIVIVDDIHAFDGTHWGVGLNQKAIHEVYTRAIECEVYNDELVLHTRPETMK